MAIVLNFSGIASSILIMNNLDTNLPWLLPFVSELMIAISLSKNEYNSKGRNRRNKKIGNRKLHRNLYVAQNPVNDRRSG